MPIKPFYEDDYVVEYEGHVLKVLGQLPAESVHMVMTSIPYWGLRDYGLEPQVWDDPGGCDEHEWGDEKVIKTGRNDGDRARLSTGSYDDGGGEDKYYVGKQTGSQGQFCRKCNAWRGSLGLEPTPELFISHIVQVFRELWRVGRKDCTVWLNIGDSYANSGLASPQLSKSTLTGGKKIHAPQPWKSMKGLKPKDLVMIPARVALALQADGWWLRSDIIWSKNNPMPESCTDRPTKSHEYVFLLTKSGTSQFWSHRDHAGTREKPKADYRWVDQITEEEVSVAPPDWKEVIICPNCEGKGRALVDLSYEFLGVWTEYWAEDECPVCEGKKKIQKWQRINLWKGHDYFYDMDAVREPKLDPMDDIRRVKKASQYNEQHPNMGKWAHKKLPDPNIGRNLRSVWTIATEPFPQAHFATFPARLCEIAIKAGTSEKGCCSNCGSPYVRVKSIDKCGAPCYNDKHEKKTMQGLSESEKTRPILSSYSKDMQSMCSEKTTIGLVGKQRTEFSKSKKLPKGPQGKDSEKEQEIPPNRKRHPCNASRVQQIPANGKGQDSCKEESKELRTDGKRTTSRPDSMQQEKGLVERSKRELHSTRLDRHSDPTTEQMSLLQRAIQPEDATNHRPCGSINQNGGSRKKQHSSGMPPMQFKEMESSWRPSCKCKVNDSIPCTVLDPFSGSGRALTTARKLGRKAIGIDLKREYLEMPLEELKRLDRWERKSFKL